MTSSACAQLDVISGQPVLLAYKRKVDLAICLPFLLFTAACIVGYFSLTYILRGQGEISLLCPTYCMQEQPRSCNLRKFPGYQPPATRTNKGLKMFADNRVVIEYVSSHPGEKQSPWLISENLWKEASWYSRVTLAFLLDKYSGVRFTYFLVCVSHREKGSTFNKKTVC